MALFIMGDAFDEPCLWFGDPTDSPALVAQKTKTHPEMWELITTHVRWVDECRHCGKSFAHPPVQSPDEMYWLGPRLAATYCSDECIDAFAEHQADLADLARMGGQR